MNFLYNNIVNISLLVSCIGSLQAAPANRILARPTEHQRLMKQPISIRFQQTPLSEVISKISDRIQIALKTDKAIRDRSVKATLHCSGMAPAQVLIAIAAMCEGEWIRQEKGFLLIPLGQNPDPYENLINRVDSELMRISPDSLFNPESIERYQNLRYRLDNQFAPWLPQDYADSTVTRKQLGNHTIWSLEKRESSQIGNIYRERTQIMYWTNQSPGLTN
ncbi:MAG: hypothetical protein IT210_19640 [Armatimonadetes bacterium]|nr:hypothetical protein [Armatimonadota bacterium]